MAESPKNKEQAAPFAFVSGREALAELENSAWEKAEEVYAFMGGDWVSRNQFTHRILPGHSSIAQRVVCEMISDGRFEVSGDRRKIRKVTTA
jgi:hypothetical protein